MKRGFVFLCLVTAPAVAAFGQAVDVTVTLDRTNLVAGQTTRCRVWAAIKPSMTNQSEQIFSWYVDWLNASGSVARAEFGSLAMAASDNGAGTSSPGVTDGAHRRGIYNTLMGRAGAGRTGPVELLSVPITALAPGATVFRAQPGTTVPNLAHDFIVATTNQPMPFTGGDYASAAAVLTVHPAPSLAVVRGTNAQPRISFPVIAGLDYRVEYRDSLLAGPDWQPLPGAPHNAGVLADTNAASPSRIYRVLTLAP